MYKEAKVRVGALRRISGVQEHQVEGRAGAEALRRVCWVHGWGTVSKGTMGNEVRQVTGQVGPQCIRVQSQRTSRIGGTCVNGKERFKA